MSSHAACSGRVRLAAGAALPLLLVACSGAGTVGAAGADAGASSGAGSLGADSGGGQPGVVDRTPARGAGRVVGVPPAGAPRAVEVLRTWDRARSRAFAEGDVAALRELYVAGSTAGTSDAVLLEAYLRRGVRVEGMRMQVLALEVLREEEQLLRVRVTDRLTGAEAVGRGARTALPRDRASTRVIELRRSGDGNWQVATVRESALRPAAR